MKLDLATLWRQPLSINYVTYSAEPYLYMTLDTKAQDREIKTHKLMKITPKMQTCIRHARGFRSSAKESYIRMTVYKLLVCHTAVNITPVELEQETESVTLTGETDKPYILYTYLMTLIQRFLLEAINEQEKLL